MVCFDTTASMDDIIGALVRQTQAFVSEAATLGFGIRWGLVAFGDIRVAGDKIVRYPFTDDKDKFKAALKEMPRFSGGGNTGETCLDALGVVASHKGWRQSAPHLCVLLTDEPPVGVNVDLEAVGKQLRQNRIVTLCVAPDHKAYRWLAQVTGGSWWSIDEPIPYDQMLSVVAKRVAAIAGKMLPTLHSGDGGTKPSGS